MHKCETDRYRPTPAERESTSRAILYVCGVTLAVLCAISALFLLKGCAYWKNDMPDYRPKAVSIEYISDLATLRGVCLNSMSEACAFRSPGTCRVILGPNADSCVLAHELKHCAGYIHDQRPTYRYECGEK